MIYILQVLVSFTLVYYKHKVVTQGETQIYLKIDLTNLTVI